jgi:hypothetical protein
VADKALMVREDLSLQDLGTVLAKSGFFADTRDAGQAIVKVLAGRELGLGAIAAMTGIYIVKGRVTLSANLMAALVKRSGKYNYRILEHTEKVCEIAFFEGKEEVGRSRFTLEDAKRAGTQNMEKYPKNMLFARAMSNGVKWFCADVTGGPIYTPDELGAQVDGDGDVIEMPAQASKTANGNGHAPEPEPGEELLETKVPTTNHEAPTEKFTPAKFKVRAETPEWKAGCAEIAQRFPKYAQADGTPNQFHILSAAKKCGFDEVNDGNYEDAIDKIIESAGAEAQPA